MIHKYSPLHCATAAIAAVLAVPAIAAAAPSAGLPSVAPPTATASVPQIVIPQTAPVAPAQPALDIAPAAPPVPEQPDLQQNVAPPGVTEARPSRAARPTPQRPASSAPRDLERTGDRVVGEQAVGGRADVGDGSSIGSAIVTEATAPVAPSPALPSDMADSTPQVIAEESGLPIELILLGGGALIAAGFGLVYVGGRRGGPSNDATAKPKQVTVPVAPTVSTGFKPSTSTLAREPVTAPVTAPVIAPVTLGVTALSRQPIGGRRPVGYHEMLAERGPSADNPFLTRKNRLRRARFYDRQESDFAVPPRIGAAGR